MNLPNPTKYAIVEDEKVNDHPTKGRSSQPKTDMNGNKHSLRKLIMIHKNKTRVLLKKISRVNRNYHQLSTDSTSSKLHKPSIQDVMTIDTPDSVNTTRGSYVSNGKLHILNKYSLKLNIMIQSEKTRQILTQTRNKTHNCK